MSVDSKKTHLDEQPGCIRCGTCCQKGGPALHKADRNLIVDRRIRLIDIVTFRIGEPALNPVDKSIIELPCEMIKITGISDTIWQCKFYSEEQSACLIYEHRPLECKTLKCWQPEDVASLFLKEMLCRSDLIPSDNPIWDVVKAYEKTFSIPLIAAISQQAASGIKEADLELKKLEQFDIQFRNKVASAFNLEFLSLNFFLGRTVKALAATLTG